MDNYVLGALLSSLGGIVNNIVGQLDGKYFGDLFKNFKSNLMQKNQLNSSYSFGNLADRGFPSSYSRR